MSVPEPAVGEGVEHAAKVSSGMKAARAKRDRYIRALHSGEMPLRFVIAASKSKEHESLSRIRLLDILSGVPGWTITAATEALLHNGFSTKSNLKDVRNSIYKTETFESLVNSGPDRWRPRPKMPEGWPWYGKLAELMADPSISVPREFEEISGGAVESRSETAPPVRSSDADVDNILDDLLGGFGDDDDEDSNDTTSDDLDFNRFLEED